MGEQNGSGDESDVYADTPSFLDLDDNNPDDAHAYIHDYEEINFEKDVPFNYEMSSKHLVLAQKKLKNTLLELELEIGREKRSKMTLSEGLKNFLDNLKSLTAEAEKLNKSGYQDEGMELNIYVTKSYDALANFLNNSDEKAFSERLDKHTARAKLVFESKYHLSIFSLIPNILRKILGIPPKTMQIINANAKASKNENRETCRKIKEEITELRGGTTEHAPKDEDNKGYKNN